MDKPRDKDMGKPGAPMKPATKPVDPPKPATPAKPADAPMK